MGLAFTLAGDRVAQSTSHGPGNLSTSWRRAAIAYSLGRRLRL